MNAQLEMLACIETYTLFSIGQFESVAKGVVRDRFAIDQFNRDPAMSLQCLIAQLLLVVF